MAVSSFIDTGTHQRSYFWCNINDTFLQLTFLVPEQDSLMNIINKAANKMERREERRPKGNLCLCSNGSQDTLNTHLSTPHCKQHKSFRTRQEGLRGICSSNNLQVNISNSKLLSNVILSHQTRQNLLNLLGVRQTLSYRCCSFYFSISGVS